MLFLLSVLTIFRIVTQNEIEILQGRIANRFRIHLKQIDFYYQDRFTRLGFNLKIENISRRHLQYGNEKPSY